MRSHQLPLTQVQLIEIRCPRPEELKSEAPGNKMSWEEEKGKITLFFFILQDCLNYFYLFCYVHPYLLNKKAILITMKLWHICSSLKNEVLTWRETYNKLKWKG